jgi:hypothetical protein
MRQVVRSSVAVIAFALLATSCGSDSGDDAGTTSGAEKVTITSPADGATVQVPFKLAWDSTVPLGPPDTGKDHVHVYVDGDESDYTVVGGTTFQVKDLAPGEHTVEISLQHADHTPVGPTSEVTVTVEGGGGSESPTSDDNGGGGYGY